MNAASLQVIRFAAVGFINTAFDFVIFNLSKRSLKLSATKASYISTTVAMVLSFFLNKIYVFEAKGVEGALKQVIYFFPATIFSLYVIHNGTIYLLTKYWRWPLNIALKIYRAIPPLRRFSDEFLTDNTAKLLATALSLISNFILYKFVVFV